METAAPRALMLQYCAPWVDAFIDCMPDMVWIKDVEGVFLNCNAVVERFFGLPRECIVGRTDYDFVPARLAAQFRENDAAAIFAAPPHVNQQWLTFPGSDGARLFETKKTAMRDAHGRILGVLGVARDITEHHRARAAQDTLNRALKLIGGCNHLMMHASDEHALLFQLCDLTVDLGGYRIACVGLAQHDETKSVTFVAWSRDSARCVEQIEASWGDGNIANGAIRRAIRTNATVINRDLLKDPTMQPWRSLAESHDLRSSISMPLLRDGKVFGALHIASSRPDAFGGEEQSLLEQMAADLAVGVQTLRACVERDEAKRQLEFLAHHDALTGTPNRLMLRSHFTHALLAARQSGSSIAVVMLDIDNFKCVNDSLGHDYGDRLLVAVARKLQRCLKSAGIICRYSGDVFAVLLSPVHSQTSLHRFMRKLVGAFTAPLMVDSNAIDISVSAGLSLFPANSDDLNTLLHYADTALQEAKRSGKSIYRVFDDGMQCDEHERVQLRTQLRSALRNGELRIHLQPKIDLASGAVAGAEALVRWQHPEQGLLGPSAFVPLAETSGLIVPIGDWVINETCRLVAAWRAKGLRLGSVSVNISVVQVRRGNLTESVAAALRRWHLPADCLELELTESLLLDDFERATKVTSGLRDLGVKLSIDDFGTGYSSLSYLKQLQVHRLKIDRSFVRDMAHDSNTLAIVKSIVHLGHNLGLAVTAEGVESEGQRSMLREIGCNEIQGFLISRPVDPLAFERWLSDFSAAEASLEAGGR